MKTPIHVLQVGMSPYYGGTEAFIMSQYREIDRTRVQFDFLNVHETEIACENEIKEYGGRIYHLNMARHQGMKKYHDNLNLFFRENSERFNVIHCNFQSLVNIDPLVYAKKYGIQVRIAHAHNSGYGQEPNWKQKLIIRKNLYEISRYANCFFACSSLAGYWMFHKEAEIINNAIDAQKYRYSEEQRKKVRAELGIGSEKVVITVGRLDPQKNPLFTLDIFAALLKHDPNYKLVIVGDGNLGDSVKNRIQEYSLSDKVMLLGTRNDVPALLQAADIFLLPSKFEGLGIVLIEAQAAGLPCFASEGVIPESVKVCDELHFVSLQKKADEWARIINACSVDSRRDNYLKICSAGYDSKKNAEILLDRYLTLVESCV